MSEKVGICIRVFSLILVCPSQPADHSFVRGMA
jgi:hypothetical protein